MGWQSSQVSPASEPACADPGIQEWGLHCGCVITSEIVSNLGSRTANPSPSTASVPWPASTFLPIWFQIIHFPPDLWQEEHQYWGRFSWGCTVCTQRCHLCGTSLTGMRAGGWGHPGWETSLDGSYSMSLCAGCAFWRFKR